MPENTNRSVIIIACWTFIIATVAAMGIQMGTTAEAKTFSPAAYGNPSYFSMFMGFCVVYLVRAGVLFAPTLFLTGAKQSITTYTFNIMVWAECVVWFFIVWSLISDINAKPTHQMFSGPGMGSFYVWLGIFALIVVQAVTMVIGFFKFRNMPTAAVEQPSSPQFPTTTPSTAVITPVQMPEDSPIPAEQTVSVEADNAKQ